MKQPSQIASLTKEQAKLHEYFISIFWNLIEQLTQSATEGEEAGVKNRICAERLCFKFIENRFEKLIKLVELHKLLYSRVEEFDLA